MPKRKFDKSLFFEPADPRLAGKISIRTPGEFRKSIDTLQSSGGKLTLTERRGLVLGKNRAKAQLKRPNLGKRERKQFKKISTMKIPPVG